MLTPPLLVGLFVLAWLAACESRVGDPPGVATEGRDPELVALLGELRGAARAQPNSGLLRGRIGMAFEANGFKAAALEAYAQAQALAPNDFRWWYFRALLLAEQGREAEALADSARAVALDGGYVPAWLWRGAWLRGAGRLEEAAAAYGRAAALGAGSPAAVGAAQVRLDQGRPREALGVLEPLARETGHPQVHRLLGQAYRRLGRAEDAEIALARGRDPAPMQWLDPRLGEKADYIAGYGGRLVHGQNLIKAERYREALTVLESLRERRPDDVALLSNLSLAYLRTGDADQALSVLRHGLEVDPDYFYLHLNIAGLHGERGDLALALPHLDEAARLQPELAHVHRQRGDLLARLGRADEAVAAYDLALRHGIRSPERVHYAAGLVEGERERWSEAIARFGSAVEIDPSFAKARIYWARCLAEAGRLDEARRELASARRLGTHARELAAAERRIADLATDRD